MKRLKTFQIYAMMDLVIVSINNSSMECQKQDRWNEKVRLEALLSDMLNWQLIYFNNQMLQGFEETGGCIQYEVTLGQDKRNDLKMVCLNVMLCTCVE